MKSPLNQILGLGAAKAGTGHWWHQRLTAVAMVPLGLWFAIAVLNVDMSSYAALVAWIREPVTAILLCLLASCLLYHSWLGVQVVLEDYVHGATKVVSLALSTFAHAVLLVVCLFSILKIAFGTG